MTDPSDSRRLGSVKHSIKIDRALTIHETAELLGVSYATARRLILSGRIPCQRVSQRRIITRESWLVEYLESVSHVAHGDSGNFDGDRHEPDR